MEQGHVLYVQGKESRNPYLHMKLNIFELIKHLTKIAVENRLHLEVKVQESVLIKYTADCILPEIPLFYYS